MRTLIIFSIILFIASGFGSCHARSGNNHQIQDNMKTISLPEPITDGTFSLEKSLSLRRSVRSFTNAPMSLENISQLMWAAQGITEPGRGFRTSPSAGATFPLEVFVVATNITGLEPGLYHYSIGNHMLEKKIDGDLHVPLLASALMQQWISQAAAIIVICADYGRTTGRYGERGIRYVHMESGHVGQNIALQAVALDLGTTMVGAFYDDQLKDVLQLPDNFEPLYIIPLGHPR